LEKWLKVLKDKKMDFCTARYEQKKHKGLELNWLADNNWRYINELRAYSNRDVNFTFFSEPHSDESALPCIDGYYICDYNKQSPPEDNYNFPLNKIQEFLANPNLGLLSENHFYLLSSNKDYVPELKEGVLDLFKKIKRIFEIHDNTLEMMITSSPNSRSTKYRFSKRGKTAVTKWKTSEIITIVSP
jgi:hypothetical protein